MKNTLFHCASDPFALEYLIAAETAAKVKLLGIGPVIPSGYWADKMQLLTGELAERFLNIVVAPMGMRLGFAKSLADFAPDSGQVNPQLAAERPDVVAMGEKAREKNLTAYSPQTALQALRADGQTNIAMLKPVRATRRELAVDLEILESYDVVCAPTDAAEQFRELGVKAIGCDPSSFAVTVKSYLP